MLCYVFVKKNNSWRLVDELIKKQARFGDLGKSFFCFFFGKIAGHLRSTELYIVNEGSLLKIEVFS